MALSETMRFGTLLIRSLWHYRRTHAAAALAAMVCTAILTGALLVGDSVRAGLRRVAEQRLGTVQYSLTAGTQPFRADLADRIHTRTRYQTAAVLITDGLLEKPDGSLRIHRVQVLGVDEGFFKFSHAPQSFSADHLNAPQSVAVNEALRQRIGQQTTELILRLQDPSALSRDLIFSADDKNKITLRLTVGSTIPDAAMGRFGLQANQQSPLNLFVPREWLARQLGAAEQANLLLISTPDACPSSAAQLDRALSGVAVLEDFGLHLVERSETGTIDLTGKQLFIPHSVGQAAMACGRDPIGIFTYFVNGLSCGGRTTPYSMVAAMGSRAGDDLFAELGDDEIVINEWLADDLAAEPGQTLQMDYFAIGPTHRLIEKSRSFRIRQIVPMLGFAADATLMPSFPGLADAENCKNWDPAIPIDLNRIRDKDEAYWDRYRGTPKAFISLKAGQSLWENRFGDLTAIRWPMANNTVEAIRSQLTAAVQPASLGLFFMDVGARGERARAGSTDFGGLFAGLSMFLILAGVILLALIFVFTIQQRSTQTGILLAMGWPKRRIYRLFLAEGALLALIGAALGTAAAIGYTAGMMLALRTIWQDAIAGAAVQFHANPTTLLIGCGGGFMISLGAMAVGLMRSLKQTPIELLCHTPSSTTGRFSRTGRWIRRALLAGCVGLFATAFLMRGSLLSQEAFFFLNGSLALLACVLLALEGMQTASRIQSVPSNPTRLVIKNIIRRPSRSLAVFLTVACGVFMVLGVGLNRKSPSHQMQRDSGTGGFALQIETTIPLSNAPDESFVRDLKQEAKLSGDLAFVPLRRHRGDDASCLNLNRAQSPTLLGVDPQAFAQRGAFSFRSAEPTDASPWSLLNQPLDDDTIPAIGDYATVYWGLGLELGKTLTMQDDRGRQFHLKIVGVLKESIFQGRLFISESNFIERFASDSGYSVLLADAETGNPDALAAALSRRLGDRGAEAVRTDVILRDFLRVENTYLAIFLALGGLGLILGSAGAGLVLLFNVLDRRGELAMMQAMGFSKCTLGRLLMAEHAGLFAAGLLAGGISALVAVLPSVLEAGSAALATGLVLPAVIFVCGVVWVALAGRAALRCDLLDSLRNE